MNPTILRDDNRSGTTDRIDKSIDQALRALTTQNDAAHGLEARILSGMAQRQHRSRRSRFAAWTRLPNLRWAGALAALLVAFLLPRESFHRQRNAPRIAPRHDTHPATALPRAVAPAAVTTGSAAAHSHTSPVVIASVPAANQSGHPTAARTAIPDEQAMLDDLHAPSHPAPQLPPTSSERAMLQVVRRGDPAQVADLDPRHRAAVAAVEQAEVDRFFYIPPPPSSPDDDHTSSLATRKAVLAKETPHVVPSRPHPSPTLDARRTQHPLRFRGTHRTDA